MRLRMNNPKPPVFSTNVWTAAKRTSTHPMGLAALTMPSVLLAGLVLLLGVPGPAEAQDSAARNLYGRGVHAYYRGDVSAARSSFTRALEHGSHDPRVYYFLGLTKLRTGDRLGAEADFNAAATIEYTSKQRQNVGLSLARIQGSDRIALERVRRATRAAIHTMPKRDAVVDSVGSGDGTTGDVTKTETYDEFDHAPPRSDSRSSSMAVEGSAGNDSDDEVGSVDSGSVVSSVMRALFNAGGSAVPSPDVGLSLPAPAREPTAAAAEEVVEMDGGLGGDLDDEFGALDAFGGAGDDTMDQPDDVAATDAETDPFAEDPLDQDPLADDGKDDSATDDSAMDDDPPGEEPLDDPFADDDPFVDELMDDGPVGEEPADADLFEGDVPADNDPFGDDPFADDPVGEDDDPFGV